MARKAKPRPVAETVLAALRAGGRMSTAELQERTGVAANNIHTAIACEVAAGTVAVEAVKPPGRRRINVYEWIGAAAAVPPAPTLNGPDPHGAAMRRCLGADCGRMFKSAHAGNRLCPRCAVWARQQADAGAFDSVHSVIRR
jgi:hypothetical protein